LLGLSLLENICVPTLQRLVGKTVPILTRPFNADWAPPGDKGTNRPPTLEERQHPKKK